jgi:hypothetical protein
VDPDRVYPVLHAEQVPLELQLEQDEVSPGLLQQLPPRHFVEAQPASKVHVVPAAARHVDPDRVYPVLHAEQMPLMLQLEQSELTPELLQHLPPRHFAEAQPASKVHVVPAVARHVDPDRVYPVLHAEQMPLMLQLEQSELTPELQHRPRQRPLLHPGSEVHAIPGPAGTTVTADTTAVNLQLSQHMKARTFTDRHCWVIVGASGWYPPPPRMPLPNHVRAAHPAWAHVPRYLSLKKDRYSEGCRRFDGQVHAGRRHREGFRARSAVDEDRGLPILAVVHGHRVG